MIVHIDIIGNSFS